MHNGKIYLLKKFSYNDFEKVSEQGRYMLLEVRVYMPMKR